MDSTVMQLCDSETLWQKRRGVLLFGGPSCNGKSAAGDRVIIRTSSHSRRRRCKGISVMGCRCNERAEALRHASAELKRGNIRGAGRDLNSIGRTLREDIRSGALARAAQARLSVLRGRR